VSPQLKNARFSLATIAIWPKTNIPVTLKAWECIQERVWLNDELIELGMLYVSPIKKSQAHSSSVTGSLMKMPRRKTGRWQGPLRS
jgi:Ulp1 family protease